VGGGGGGGGGGYVSLHEYVGLVILRVIKHI
jgi:hypothetical protein